MTLTRRFGVCALAVFGLLSQAAMPSRAAEVSAGSGPAVDASTRFFGLGAEGRLHASDDTQIVLDGGRHTTVRALRATHLALVASRNRTHGQLVPTLATGYITKESTSLFATGKRPMTEVAKTKPPLPNSVLSFTANASLTVPLQHDNGGYPFPSDYVAACKGASLCVYIPKDVFFEISPKNNALVVDDYMITDPSQCIQTGGFPHPNSSGSLTCTYAYPYYREVKFDPPAGGFAVNASCAQPPFDIYIDAHGAATVGGYHALGSTNTVAGDTYGITTTSEQLCYVVVSLGGQNNPTPPPLTPIQH